VPPAGFARFLTVKPRQNPNVYSVTAQFNLLSHATRDPKVEARLRQTECAMASQLLLDVASTLPYVRSLSK
jgi:hypothetical protein